VTYANGDRAAFVSVVYEASIGTGGVSPDTEEVLEIGWFDEAELTRLPMTPFTVTLLRAVGLITDAEPESK